ncbi:DNA-3-methyladenine glycosylase family protein [Flavisolibacter nicotianae]|uniref:DNA-3-methyladenine glycosylase family protein n=1 Tax=Flavisolibacter nicotianae TaxID=2364882 RepID=UPI000EB230C3|nr:DNA-3-methyladenine glycosylase [Flavisolibacter nicotianae]
MQQFHEQNFTSLCDQLAAHDPHLQWILSEYGYPPMWTRPNRFETLVLTILEQQVSLASAYAAYQRLKARLPNPSPAAFLRLNDEELRSCYFSRQKIVYTRELAQALLSKKVSLKRFEQEGDEVVRKELKALKGIGDWTVDIYLLHALQRTDIFPLGDLALVRALEMVNGEKRSKEEWEKRAINWKPYRSIATMMLWHFYIQKKKIRILH